MPIQCFVLQHLSMVEVLCEDVLSLIQRPVSSMQREATNTFYHLSLWTSESIGFVACLKACLTLVLYLMHVHFQVLSVYHHFISGEAEDVRKSSSVGMESLSWSVFVL